MKLVGSEVQYGRQSFETAAPPSKKLGLPLSQSGIVEICDIMIVALFVQTSVSLKTKKHIAWKDPLEPWHESRAA